MDDEMDSESYLNEEDDREAIHEDSNESSFEGGCFEKEQTRQQSYENIDQDRAEKILTLWMLRAHRAASAHYTQSAKFRDSHTAWTCTNAIYSIVLIFSVASLSNAASQSGPNFPIPFPEFVTGLFGVFLVSFGVVQFILRYSERQGTHRSAGQEFSNLQRKIERYTLFNVYTMAQVHNLSREYNHITRSYPLVKQTVWNSKRTQKLVHQIQAIEDKLRNAPEDKGQYGPNGFFDRFRRP